MPFFLRLADVFIGKPGPGTVSEALVMGVPVVVDRSESQNFGARTAQTEEARKALAAKGWNPVRAKASGDPRQAALFKHGIIETDKDEAAPSPQTAGYD